MSIKLRRTAWIATAVVASSSMLVTPGHAAETIDAFARAHLKSSQAAIASDTPASAATISAAPDVLPELMFIHGVENTTVAYLRVDGRFGYSVSDGDQFGDWRVVKIGSDFVDVSRSGKSQRLLLPNAMGASTSGGAQAGRPRPGSPG
ncbi:hypothetical protein [Pandoraea apista]|uniref:Uncharacterized protein n=1 Tax=Pandoraea apista TaxID=93218 RepID=A0A0B5FCA7_9BURK|nr:hypothetical protein [Pandoraea apista]AJE98416.1 hypothetical protein SG18_09910 [Pandoraea apista]AKH72471.1 hypothetical protein XM39_10110 [Pandoraea apista]AKI60861.1 hypothetical protein AA956_02365 [Pandoraea apista]ALS66093.1 hypothetical protein AT395_14850 [Pandoraea apista]AVF39036.1 hypothetical protein AL486_04355 [Pandoraea apista]